MIIMDKEEIKQLLSIVESALNKILIAERTIDKRRRDKAIRDAKTEAHNMVYPYKAILTDICNKEYLNGEPFDWGHLESDLQDVYRILTELYNENE